MSDEDKGAYKQKATEAQEQYKKDFDAFTAAAQRMKQRGSAS